MEATVVTYNYNLTKEQLVKVHIMFYCWSNNIKLSKTQMNICIYLGLLGKTSLSEFCSECVSKKISKCEISTRGIIDTLIKKKFMISKDGDAKNKSIVIAKDIGLQTAYNTILNIKCYYGDFKTEQV